MGILDDQLAADAAIFCDPDLFGEVVVYTKIVGNVATPVTINAQVSREDVQPIPGMPHGLVSKTLRVFVPAGSVSGIDIGADTVTLPERQGGPNVVKRVVRIVSQDPGGWTVELQ